MEDQSCEALNQSRREHFQAKLEVPSWSHDSGELLLSTTTNGTAWSSLRLTPEERDQVWALLDAERRQRKEGR